MRPLSLILIVIVTLNAVHAQEAWVEEIEMYNLSISVDGGVKVISRITLKNLISKPIVPGLVEFRIQRQVPMKLLIFPIPFTSDKKPVKISNVEAKTADGKEIKVDIKNHEDYTSLICQIWYPIEPHANLTFLLSYSSEDLIEKGILFSEIAIPIGTDMNIKKLTVTTESKLKKTYEVLPSPQIPAGGITFYRAEFSSLPLPKVGMPWSYLIWGLILFVTAGIIIMSKRRS